MLRAPFSEGFTLFEKSCRQLTGASGSCVGPEALNARSINISNDRSRIAALPVTYSPECVEGKFSELRIQRANERRGERQHPALTGLPASISTLKKLAFQPPAAEGSVTTSETSLR